MFFAGMAREGMYSYFIRNYMVPQPVPASEALKALFPRNLRPAIHALESNLAARSRVGPTAGLNMARSSSRASGIVGAAWFFGATRSGPFATEPEVLDRGLSK